MSKSTSKSSIAVLVTSLILSVHTECLAQTDWMEYYPLHEGNLWEYREYLDFPKHPPVTMTRQVVGDTLAPNGKIYKIIQIRIWDGPYPGTGSVYQRIDSLGNVFHYVAVDCQFPTVWVDTLLYRLQGAVGDSIPALCAGPMSRWFLVEKDTADFFNQSRELIRYELGYDVVRGVIVTAAGIGLIQEGFEGGDWILQGAIIDGATYGQITVSVEREFGDKVTQAEIRAYPNPFNASTTIEYYLSLPTTITVAIYDLLGRQVYILFDGTQSAGFHKAVWNGRNTHGREVASGIYLLTVRSEEIFDVRRLIFVK